MQISELSTGGHKVQSMKWNGETLYQQGLPFDTYIYSTNSSLSTPFDFSTYDFLDFSHLNPKLVVASGDVAATYAERVNDSNYSDRYMNWPRELHHHFYGSLGKDGKPNTMSSYLPYVKVTLPPGIKMKVTFRFQAFGNSNASSVYWRYYLFNSEHLVVNEGMNKLIKYEGYNSSTADCATAQFSETGSLYKEYLNAGIINAYSFGSSIYPSDLNSMIIENTSGNNKDFYFYFGFSGESGFGAQAVEKAFATGEIRFERMV